MLSYEYQVFLPPSPDPGPGPWFGRFVCIDDGVEPATSVDMEERRAFRSAEVQVAVTPPDDFF